MNIHMDMNKYDLCPSEFVVFNGDVPLRFVLLTAFFHM